ncbi:protein FATTY ACID EXPORT 2, chloroplastic-like [Papaver somniferum]|uniref:protein FATTY ACID EXPORT 2, chloroplastic-like n=1 Tax=Papaver somniferum TaxID=3469 RepID=UPI000E6FDAC8|nr:protein FATTY ACID EXPORT 2, chloroplastic-like [Papaver somniferum]
MASLTSTSPTIITTTRVSSSSSSQSSFLHPKTHLKLNPSFSPFKTNRIFLRIRGDFKVVKATIEEKTYQIPKQPELDNTGGDGGGGDIGSGGSGGDGGEEEEEFEGDKKKKMVGMSMSQKLTLAYAALVGVGGLMGYLKSGSQKSLTTGGLSALLLFYVYTQLPTNPVFASALGMGLSAALLGVMGSRFKNSGKVFPAGVVSVVSLVMTAGYLHGIVRSVLHG